MLTAQEKEVNKTKIKRGAKKLFIKTPTEWLFLSGIIFEYRSENCCSDQ